jgi:hypothetical protein
MREDGKIDYDENAFYFTRAQGAGAVKQFLKYATTEDPENPGWPLKFKLLSGETMYIKPNRRSWENRYGEMSGVTYESLEEMFPELYGKKTKAQEEEDEKKSKAAAEKKQKDEQEAKDKKDAERSSTKASKKEEDEGPKVQKNKTVDLFDEEPLDDEITALEVDNAEALAEDLEEEDAEEMETDSVAAVEVLEEDQTEEGVAVAKVYANTKFERIHTDCEAVSWKGADKKVHSAWLIEMPGSEKEYWLEEGQHTIEGETVMVEVIEK